MGLFDSFKKALGGSAPQAESVKGPSMVLREAGIDPSGLDFNFRGDGSLNVSGHVASQDDADRIVELLSDIPQVSRVDSQLVVGAAPGPEPVPEAATPEPPVASVADAATASPEAVPVSPDAAPEGTEAPADTGEAAAGRTYTVQSGDSLWKVAEAMYGNGAKYTAIFEANRDLLDDPDKIFPGQELRIPDLDD